MPIEIKELVLKATVRTSNTKPEDIFVTREEFAKYDRNLRREISREIEKEIRLSKRGR